MKRIKEQKEKIVVGMSGGVDSSIAAFLLKKQGFEVIGVSLRFGVWDNEKNLLKENVCCSSGAFLIAKNICNFLGIKHEVIDVKKDFFKNVFDYWKKEIKNYYTPNPCMICNHAVKIQALINYAKKIDAQYVATGHYAKIKYNLKTQKYELQSSKDKKKNQVYFLGQLSQAQLKKLKLPLGDYKKEEIYKIAKKLKLKVFQKTKQSQDFCFVANKSYNNLIKDQFGIKTGNIIDEKGIILGKHQGLFYYTIGQRKGINLSGGPFYVLEKNNKKNELIVTKNKQKLFKDEFLIDNIKWTDDFKKLNKDNLLVQIRYQDKKTKAKIQQKNNGQVKVFLTKPKMAITPGQFAVFYKIGKCVGIGRIIKT